MQRLLSTERRVFDLENLCPACNGIISLERICPACGAVAQDGGVVEDYYGPYSPYEDDETVLTPVAAELATKYCLHLVYCLKCGWDERVKVDKLTPI